MICQSADFTEAIRQIEEEEGNNGDPFLLRRVRGGDTDGEEEGERKEEEIVE